MKNALQNDLSSGQIMVKNLMKDLMLG